MKYAFTIGVVIFWCVIAFIMFNGYVSYSNIKNAPTGNVPTSQNPISATVLAQHATQNDCWLSIGTKAYDVTAYMSFHPGGAKRIVDYCGKDASTAFSTNGPGLHKHSADARAILKNYLIGDIAS